MSRFAVACASVLLPVGLLASANPTVATVTEDSFGGLDVPRSMEAPSEFDYAAPTTGEALVVAVKLACERPDATSTGTDHCSGKAWLDLYDEGAQACGHSNFIVHEFYCMMVGEPGYRKEHWMASIECRD
jgi:hypothetical protein